DLDLETLELLEEQLVDWPGTLLLVSHDRAFLDNIVTSTIAFEGDGRVREYVGGYTDWLRQRSAMSAVEPPRAGKESTRVDATPVADKKRLSYNERRELEQLPSKIEALESEQQRLESAIAASEFYKEPREVIEQTLARLEALRGELTTIYTRWDELDSRSL